MSKKRTNNEEHSPETKGGRSPTGVSGGGEIMGQRRWSRARKKEVVLRMLRGESTSALSRELGVEIYRLQEWHERALRALDEGLRERIGDPVHTELDAAYKQIGEIAMDNELLRRKIAHLEGKHPLGRGRLQK